MPPAARAAASVYLERVPAYAQLDVSAPPSAPPNAAPPNAAPGAAADLRTYRDLVGAEIAPETWEVLLPLAAAPGQFLLAEVPLPAPSAPRGDSGGLPALLGGAGGLPARAALCGGSSAAPGGCMHGAAPSAAPAECMQTAAPSAEQLVAVRVPEGVSGGDRVSFGLLPPPPPLLPSDELGPLLAATRVVQVSPFPAEWPAECHPIAIECLPSYCQRSAILLPSNACHPIAS